MMMALFIYGLQMGFFTGKRDLSFETPNEVLDYCYPNHEILYEYDVKNAVLYHIADLDNNTQKILPVIFQDGFWKSARKYNVDLIDLETKENDYAYQINMLQIKETNQTFVTISHMISITQQPAEIYDNQDSIFEMHVFSSSVLDDYNTVMYYTLIETSDDYVLYIDGEAFVLD